ncbi:M28 family peptidase [candidate division KSB1 bacterium]
MKIKNAALYSVIILCVIMSSGTDSFAQRPEAPKTILPETLLDEFINELSGTLPFNHITELGAYTRDRLKDEYEGTYWESEYMSKMARLYGYSDVNIERLGDNRQQWDAEIGELWIVEPEKRLLISHKDEPVCLARGSKDADVTAELVFAGDGGRESDYTNLDVKGKIVIGTGRLGSIFRQAVTRLGALGVVGFNSLNPIDMPDQIAWSSIGGRGRRDPQAEEVPSFGFNLTQRIGLELTKRLLAGEKIKVRAKVKTTTYMTDNEITTAVIPGKTDEEVVYVAHLFEGVTKQGAIDDFSGCAVNLEVGRAFISLIKSGILPQPERTIRFLWVPEISGSRQYLIEHPDETKKMIAAINLDMVGEDQKLGKNCMVLHLTPYSYSGFLNDICQEFYEYTGITNRERISERRYLKPIFDIHGSRDPFRYRIDPYFGSSDHIVFLSPQFGIPSVMFINWPDPVYHTNMDRNYMADPTQLKRVAFITAAAGYTIANAKPEDVLKIGTMMLGKSKQRIADDVVKFTRMMFESSSDKVHEFHKEANIGIEEAYKREVKSIRTLGIFAKTDKNANNVINELAASIETGLKGNLELVEKYYKTLCKNFGVKTQKISLTKAEKDASKLVPVYTPEGSGGGSMFRRGGRIRGFAGNELLNYADGKMNMLEIRNAVSAQFTPLKIEDVVAHYKNLEEQGTIKINKK